MNPEPPQLLPPSSTDPRPPTGDTPTQPPLSSSSTVGTAPVEVANKFLPINIADFHLYQPYYINYFVIRGNLPTNTRIFDLKFEDIFLRRDDHQKGVAGWIWQYIPMLYSAQCKFEVELVLRPVKVGDSIVTLDYMISYDGETNYTHGNSYDNDWMEVVIQDTQDIVLPIPALWINEMIQCEGQFPPAMIPQTRVLLRIKNPYSTPPIHPDHFSVLAFIRFKNFVGTEIVNRRRGPRNQSWPFEY